MEKWLEQTLEADTGLREKAALRLKSNIDRYIKACLHDDSDLRNRLACELPASIVTQAEFLLLTSQKMVNTFISDGVKNIVIDAMTKPYKEAP